MLQSSHNVRVLSSTAPLWCCAQVWHQRRLRSAAKPKEGVFTMQSSQVSPTLLRFFRAALRAFLLSASSCSHSSCAFSDSSARSEACDRFLSLPETRVGATGAFSVVAFFLRGVGLGAMEDMPKSWSSRSFSLFRSMLRRRISS